MPASRGNVKSAAPCRACSTCWTSLDHAASRRLLGVLHVGDVERREEDRGLYGQAARRSDAETAEHRCLIGSTMVAFLPKMIKTNGT